MLRPHEVGRNRVVRPDPQVLLEHGAEPSTRPQLAVQGPHYFVCIGRCAVYSVWIPSYSRPSNGRIKLRRKDGLRSWIEGESFVDAAQLWVIPDAALGPASIVDVTRSGCRNFASTFFLFPPIELAETA